MNWEAIGAIGEIIGALAVFLTLAYLAIKISLFRTKAALVFAKFRDGKAEVNNR